MDLIGLDDRLLVMNLECVGLVKDAMVGVLDCVNGEEAVRRWDWSKD